MKSLLEQLPSIVADGKREAERVIERADSRTRLGLQTRELVIPSKDAKWQDLFKEDWLTYADGLPTNRLIYGDNLLAMAALLNGDSTSRPFRGGIDLIYIDPPFDSKADYRHRIFLDGSDLQNLPTAIEQFAYADTWVDGTASYLRMICPRLHLMRELLKDEGSIFVHIDWHLSGYIRLLLDEIFGKENFRNEIIWQKIRSVKAQSKAFGNVHDCIYWYSKSDSYFYQNQFTKPSEEYVSKFDRVETSSGRRYQLVSLVQKGQGPARRFGDALLEPGPGRHWIWSQERIDAALAGGLIEFTANGTPRKKQYLDDSPGQIVDDIWEDIYPVNSQAKEALNYQTQKPEALLERIIRAASPPRGIVADFFAGSGTVGAVAETLDRPWIIADLGKPACMISRKRLIDEDAKPFLYQHIGDYQVEQMRSTLGSKFRIGDLAEIVLGLFGALPLPVEENPNRNMGRLQGNKTLVLADSPNKMTGLATLRRAIEIRDNLMGGWDKVVVLGWNFSPTIGHDIEALGQGERLEVLVIPPDLLDRMKKKGHKLKADEVRFSSLQYLKLGEVKREQTGDGESLSVSIANYVLLSPEALNLDEANREKLQKKMNADPLALIEYWSIDPDYDGEVFRSVWQDYRGNTDNDDDPFRVITTARLTGLSKKDGERRVCVRVVDVFGFEAEATVEVA